LATSTGQGHRENQANEPMMWQEFINQLPTKDIATFQHLTLKEEGHPIVQAIMSSHMIAVSDRSFKDKQGITVWIFYDHWDQKTSHGEGAITTPSTRTVQGSYRSKLAGIYRIITTVNMLLSYHWQTQGAILIVCNGKAALTKCMKLWASNPLDKQFDIIHTICARIRKTKVKWSSKHIKGHQDQAALVTCDKARWNDAMDQAAKKHWQKIQLSPDLTMHSLLGEPWELWLVNKKVSTAVKHQLLEHTCGQAMREYWSNKYPDFAGWILSPSTGWP